MVHRQSHEKCMHLTWLTWPKLEMNHNVLFFMIYFIDNDMDYIKVTKVLKTPKWESWNFQVIVNVYTLIYKLITPLYGLWLRSCKNKICNLWKDLSNGILHNPINGDYPLY
jgi:hypothetical protein